MGENKATVRKPVLLVILDGFGVNPSKANNAIALANTPHFDHYFSTYPHTVLEASGHACGLPDGQMGNSEVGHITLGCGALIRQDLVKIDDSIADGSFFNNEALKGAMLHGQSHGQLVHLVGLVSDGGVHSHLNHVLALIEMARSLGVRPVVHMITDGRDTAPQLAATYLPKLEQALHAANGCIATVSGRYYAMDRDNRWERTELAWRAMVQMEGEQAPSAAVAIERAYAQGMDDEFIKPTVISGGLPIAAGEAVIFFNFRKDRPRQLAVALFRDDFNGFERGAGYIPVRPTCMTLYDREYGLPFAFHADKPLITLGHYIADLGLKQFRCAETEKFAHVTYFLNGGHSEAYPGEDRVIVPSPGVATYDLKPEMSAHEVANEVIGALQSAEYALIVVNFANGDMVGHTAVREAVIAAVEALDREVGRVLECAEKQGYAVVLTSDHGNCDELVDPVTAKPHTQHSIYPVPCLVIDDQPWRMRTGGQLRNVAPTVLHLMGLPQPPAMPAPSLLVSPTLE